MMHGLANSKLKNKKKIYIYIYIYIYVKQSFRLEGGWAGIAQ